MLLDLDAIARDQAPDRLGVAGLLEALEADGLREHRVGLGVAQRLHANGRRGLRPGGLLPDRQPLQAGQGLGVQVRPGDLFGLERVVGFDEDAAEELLVLV